MKKHVLCVAVVMSMILTTATTSVFAGQYDLKEITPEIQQALDGRRDRYEALQLLKQAGLIGEDNRGYIAVLEQRKDASQIAYDENRDRKVIYTAIAEQNGLIGAIGTIESVFADVQRNNALRGEKIQRANGQWITK